MMQFNVAGLLMKPTGDKREVTFDERVAVEIADARLTSPIRGRATLIREPSGVLVQATATTTLAMQCSRCLVPIEHELQIAVTESFVPTVPIPGGPPVQVDRDSDPATWIDEKHVLDLSEVTRQAIVLAAPLNAVCRDDCRGLCPQCGHDLNEGPCSCEPAPDPRWDELRMMIDAD
jgi:uncharacterized protein